MDDLRRRFDGVFVRLSVLSFRVALSWNNQSAEFDIVGGIEVRFLVRSNTAVVSHWFLARPGKVRRGLWWWRL